MKLNRLQSIVNKGEEVKEARMGQFGEFLTTGPVKTLLK